MPESPWRKAGATLNHKNACKECGLTEAGVIAAMRAGTRQYRQNSAHGNPYFRLLRSEVESLVLEIRGGKDKEAQKINHQLQESDTEIRSIRRRLASLERQKFELLEIQRQTPHN
jgi:hypothetical protein